MEGPTEEFEAFIPMESPINISSGRNMLRLSGRSRCAAKLQSAQNPGISHRRRPRHSCEYLQEEAEKMVQVPAGKDWAAIASLVLGRMKGQCTRRWHYFLRCSIDKVHSSSSSSPARLLTRPVIRMLGSKTLSHLLQH
jgi:hypothetical protein